MGSIAESSAGTSLQGSFAEDRAVPSVVVIGAGFAGINAAYSLRDAPVRVTLIDRNNFHTFQPLLYQVATAYLGPEEVGSAVRSVFRKQDNLDFKVGEVTAVDWDEREVHTLGGDRFAFDYLVVAAGAKVSYFGIEGMEDNAWPLYTMADAILLRQHLLWRLEVNARRSADKTETVVVVGGGPTGVETAGALASMGHDLFGPEHARLRVVLIEALPSLLNAFDEVSQRRALVDLERREVEVRLSTAVASADEEGVTLANGERIETPTVVWAAGIASQPIGEVLGLPTGKKNAILVDEDLRVHGRDDVFAIGDVATVDPAPAAGQPPLLAPNAIQSGKHVGKQIQRLASGKSTKPYKYLDKGILAVIGRRNAVAELPLWKTKLRFGGTFAWLLWLGVHVIYLIGFRNRLKVIVDWVWNYLTSRGSAAIMLRSEDLSKRWKQEVS